MYTCHVYLPRTKPHVYLPRTKPCRDVMFLTIPPPPPAASPHDVPQRITRDLHRPPEKRQLPWRLGPPQVVQHRPQGAHSPRGECLLQGAGLLVEVVVAVGVVQHGAGGAEEAAEALGQLGGCGCVWVCFDVFVGVCEGYLCVVGPAKAI